MDEKLVHILALQRLEQIFPKKKHKVNDDKTPGENYVGSKLDNLLKNMYIFIYLTYYN